MVEKIKNIPRWGKAIIIMVIVAILCIHPLTRAIVIFILPIGPGMNEFIFFILMGIAGIVFFLKFIIEYLLGKRNSIFKENDIKYILSFIQKGVKKYVERHPEDADIIMNACIEATGSFIVTDITSDTYDVIDQRSNGKRPYKRLE